MTIPDPIKDVRDLLLADAGVTALVGTRVFHSELPENESAAMPQHAVVIAQAGGPGRLKRMNTRRVRLDTICYGATLYESQQLHQAVREALEALDKTSGCVKAIECVSDGQNGRDPMKQWPVCFASYRVLTTISV